MTPPPDPRAPRPADEQQIVTMLRWLLYAVFVVIGWTIIGELAHVMTPILIAFGIAYLLDPILERMVARGMSRTVAATILLVSFLGTIVTLGIILIPMAIHEVQVFIGDLPRIVENAGKWMAANTGFDVPDRALCPGDVTATASGVPAGGVPAGGVPAGGVPVQCFAAAGEPTATAGWKEYLKSDEFKGVLEKAIGPAKDLLAAAVGGVFSLLGFLAEMLLVPVFAYYFLLDWPNITGRIKKIVPPRRRGKVLEILGEVDGVVSGWVRGQAMVTSILAILYAIAFSIVGIHLAIPIGLLVGALTVIPFVGTFVGAAIVIGLTLLDWQGIEPLVGVIIVIVVLHLLEATVLTPKIVGHKVGLSESAALFAVVAGGKLLGFVGILLAVPIAATIAVFIRHLVRRYERSEFFGHEDDALIAVTDAMSVIMPEQNPTGIKRSEAKADEPAKPDDDQ